ncbi:hypothetical protein KM043_017814 [Ampulex compressa]|nr:hypothetical protein KM043_017814 [Ampulex compressa]
MKPAATRYPRGRRARGKPDSRARTGRISLASTCSVPVRYTGWEGSGRQVRTRARFKPASCPVKAGNERERAARADFNKRPGSPFISFPPAHGAAAALEGPRMEARFFAPLFHDEMSVGSLKFL